MEKRVLLIYVVGFLGVIAAALGFAADSVRIQESQIQFSSDGKCSYPKSPAFNLGLTAFLVLVVAHAIINASVCCSCCNKLLSNGWVSCDLFSAVFSWLTFALASLYLLEGTFLNYRHVETYSLDCSVVLKPWKFVNGSLWGLLSVVLGILYYHSISSTKNMNQMGNPGNANNHGSIAMTQPQVPAQMTLQEPVFVPEDTYNRRQMV